MDQLLQKVFLPLPHTRNQNYIKLRVEGLWTDFFFFTWITCYAPDEPVVNEMSACLIYFSFPDMSQSESYVPINIIIAPLFFLLLPATTIILIQY